MTFKKLFNGREEAFDVDRFAQRGVKSGVQHPLPIPGHHRCGHGHDGNLPRGNVGSWARPTPSSPVSASMIS